MHVLTLYDYGYLRLETVVKNLERVLVGIAVKKEAPTHFPKQ